MIISTQDAKAVLGWLDEQTPHNNDQTELLKKKKKLRNYILNRLQTGAKITIKMLETIRTEYGI